MERRAILTITVVSVTALVSRYLLLLFFTDISRVEAMGLEGIFVVTLLSHSIVVTRDIFIPLFLALTPFYSPILLGLAAFVGGRLVTSCPISLVWASRRRSKSRVARRRTLSVLAKEVWPLGCARSCDDTTSRSPGRDARGDEEATPSETTHGRGSGQVSTLRVGGLGGRRDIQPPNWRYRQHDRKRRNGGGEHRILHRLDVAA